MVASGNVSSIPSHFTSCYSGLPNRGNTCFGNASFQFLRFGLYETPLTFKLSCITEFYSEFNNPLLKTDPLYFAKRLDTIFTDFAKNSSQYVFGDQFDASEFLICNLNEECCLEACKISSKLISSCSFCSETWCPTINDPPSWFIDLQVQRPSTVQSVLEEYTEPEFVNEAKCVNCKREGGCLRCLEIHLEGKALIVFLKRAMLNGGKNSYEVDYRQDITFGSKSFRFASCMIHIDKETESERLKHYVTIARTSDDSYFEFNDSLVTKIDEEQAFSHCKDVCAVIYVEKTCLPPPISVAQPVDDQAKENVDQISTHPVDLVSPTKEAPKKNCFILNTTSLPSACFAPEGFFSVPVSNDEATVVHRAQNIRNKAEVVANYFFSFLSAEMEVKGIDIQTLLPGTWLNDEVINCAMDLMQEREMLRVGANGAPRVHFFSSFFYSKVRML